MKEIFGRSEWVSIPGYGVDWFCAKVNTGRRESLLHATEVQPFKKGEEEWVSFKTVDDVSCEAEVVTVEEREEDGELVRSYYVEIWFETLDGKEREFLVCLSPRCAKRYLLVLGRSALVDVLVDSNRRYLLGKFPGFI